MLCRLLSEGHVAFLETVPFKAIAFFTVLQFIGLAAVYVVASWTGVRALSFYPHLESFLSFGVHRSHPTGC